VALLIMALTTKEALEETMEAYYERYHFAEVFSSVERAPERLADEIRRISGVRAAETRIVHLATLNVAGFPEPATGQIVSLPKRGEPLLNRLVLLTGALPSAERVDEAVISEKFAEAHVLRPGDSLAAILNGRKRELRIVGIALSPEFVHTIAPGGLMPDNERFGIVWMGHDALAAAFDMEEAFNDVSVTLLRGVDPQAVIARLDHILADYGGTGAYDRGDHISNWFLENEIDQQKNMAGIMPPIFLAVAAFLTSMVMNRLIATERSEIGLLKAFGYSNWEIGWHYAKMVLCIAGLGVLIGFVAGSWLGHFNTSIHAERFRFPFLLYRPGAESYVIAALVSLGAALFGSLGALRRAMALPPADAMRPPAPPVFRRSHFSDSTLGRALDEPSRMISRVILRWPLRFVMSATGVALAIAVLMLSLQWVDAVDFLAEEHFDRAQHQDATILLYEAQAERVIHDIAALPGVLAVETARSVAARIRKGPITRRHAITGVRTGHRIAPIHDATRGDIDPSPEGVVLSTKLAEILGVGPGDTIDIEILEGRRPRAALRVAGTFEAYIDTPLYLHLDTLNRLMRDPPLINLAHLAVDPNQRADFLAALKETPKVSAVAFRDAAKRMFEDTIAETIFIFIGFFILFACTLGFGVLYNTLRIALSERGRELATLRVLGFSRAEIAYILLGESGVVTLAAIPLGIAFGFGLIRLLSEAFETELFRVPPVIEHATVGLAVAFILATLVVCAAIVRGRLDRLDLISVLKTRE
jgi:putative ABC transport system permease protein